MLDVLNEELIAKGEEPIAFDHDCREGICGMCGFMINGVAHGPAARHHRLPASHAPLQGRRRALPGAVARAGFPVIKDLVGRPQRVRPHHRRRRLHLGADRQRAGRQRHPGAEGRRRPRHGRGGLHRLRRLRGGVSQRLGGAVHRRQDLAPRHAAAGPARARAACADMVAQVNARRLRKLHQHRRVRGGVPEGNQARSDRAHESRLPARAVVGTRRGRRDGRGISDCAALGPHQRSGRNDLDFWQLPALTAGAVRGEHVGFFVADNLLFLRIPLQLPIEPAREVRKVTHRH